MDIKFPGGSKSRVNAAGDAVRNNCATADDLQAIEAWRAAHNSVLNTFQALLRNRAKDYGAQVAQRLKRKSTIFDKLHRQPRMSLARMEDVAGCRVIFHSIDDLNAFRTELHQATFRHTLKNDLDKYNYIRTPKQDGYRSIHDVFEYDVNSPEGRHLKGLHIEIQYRTLVQHAWATTNEILGFITGSQPKYHRGDARFVEAMALASEYLARSEEKRTGPLPSLSNSEVAQRFYQLEFDLGLLIKLRALQVVERSKGAAHQHVVLMKTFNSFSVHHYESGEEAMKALFELELRFPHADVLYVTADTVAEIQLAFKNYYNDATDFLAMIQSGAHNLGMIPPVT